MIVARDGAAPDALGYDAAARAARFAVAVAAEIESVAVGVVCTADAVADFPVAAIVIAVGAVEFAPAELESAAFVACESHAPAVVPVVVVVVVVAEAVATAATAATADVATFDTVALAVGAFLVVLAHVGHILGIAFDTRRVAPSTIASVSSALVPIQPSTMTSSSSLANNHRAASAVPRSP